MNAGSGVRIAGHAEFVGKQGHVAQGGSQVQPEFGLGTAEVPVLADPDWTSRANRCPATTFHRREKGGAGLGVAHLVVGLEQQRRGQQLGGALVRPFSKL